MKHIQMGFVSYKTVSNPGKMKLISHEMKSITDFTKKISHGMESIPQEIFFISCEFFSEFYIITFLTQPELPFTISMDAG